tara:strand:- start:19685 stop:19921 length:237 start_codon:yes stop_codon:yes gene_type:complete
LNFCVFDIFAADRGNVVTIWLRSWHKNAQNWGENAFRRTNKRHAKFTEPIHERVALKNIVDNFGSYRDSDGDRMSGDN